MGKKSKKHRVGVVYSTNPDFAYSYDQKEQSASVLPAEQRLHVYFEKKGRRGKVVTLIDGYAGSEDGLNDLARRLKSSCGVGGSAKDGQIILQGNLREKTINLLRQWGYGVK